MFRFYWITCMRGRDVGGGWGGDAGTFMFVTFQRGWGGGGVEPGVFLDLRKKKQNTLPRLRVAPLLGQRFAITQRGRLVIKRGKNGMERSQWKKKN